MKKLLIIAGLVAVSSVAAVAASVKTSKAVPLSETQMASVKGQGTVIAYVWFGTSYVAQSPVFTSCYDPYTHIVYSGGPLNGYQYQY